MGSGYACCFLLYMVFFEYRFPIPEPVDVPGSSVGNIGRPQALAAVGGNGSALCRRRRCVNQLMKRLMDIKKRRIHIDQFAFAFALQSVDRGD